MTAASVLVIDDEPLLREGLAKLLAKEGYRVHAAGDGESGFRLVRTESIDVVVTDLRMPGLSGVDVLRQIKDAGLPVEVILLTGHATVENAVAAMKQGAFDYLTKPPDTERLLQVVARAAERQEMLRRTRAFEAAHGNGFERPLIAESAAMKRVMELVGQVAALDSTVLVQGESGTGKELVAKALHARGPRGAQPLIAVNCAAIPNDLLESELFGYEKGAFTGALRRKPGKFELADRGTLFLDEIAELAPPLQAKLLRVLQEREVERLGGTEPVRVDVRIIAATNQDLRKLAAERRFRDDLYYRLKVVTIDLPPLRHRDEDLLPLAEHFLKIQARRLGKTVEGFTTDALARMRLYHWPGNVRELEHAIERAAILAREPALSASDLGLGPEDGPALPERGSLEDIERHWILATLERHRRNQASAAEELGIDRTTLRRKLKQYGVQ